MASTVVSHLSKYILLNRTVYEDSFEWQDVWTSTGYSDVEVVLVQVKVTGKLISNPLNADTDGDGLTDEEEIYYYGTNPFKSDTDGDGLTDSLEIALWFDPLQADADGDGRLDLQEYQEGTNPFDYDKDWYEHVWDFLCGLIAGDFLQETESVSVVLGQITSGLVPIADARDVIANAVHGDWGFAGLSAVGLIPVAGDVTKTGSKIGKFILKNIDNAPKVANVLTFMTKNFPDITKELSKSDEFVDAVKQLSKTDTSKLTKKEVEGINEALEKAGLDEYKIIKGGKYTNLDDGLNFSNKALEHMGDAGRQVPVQTLQDAIRYGEAMPDPRGSSATMYYTTMYKNGKMYNLEVLYDEITNTVYHFEYARKAMGNLPAISK